MYDTGLTSTGLMFYDGQKKATAHMVTHDFFSDPNKKKQGRPSGAPRMTGLALGYHLALFFESGGSNAAKERVSSWTGADSADIAKALRRYSPVKNAKLLIVSEHAGIVALHEPYKIRIDGGKLFYRGRMSAWRIGDDVASIGFGAFDGIDAPLLIDSPKKKKK